MGKISVKDLRILNSLDMDARKPIAQVAKEVGVSRQVVEYRIKRMQKDNIIFGGKAIFDSVVAGFNWYRIAFRLLNVTKDQKSELIQFLTNHPHTLWLGEVGGNWDLVLNLICKDNFVFNSIFENIITEFGKCIRDYEILIYIDVHDYNRAYILGSKNQREEFYHQMQYNPRVTLDDLDRRIITELSKDALLTNLELGKKLNVSGNTIKNRIHHLRKSKLLLGFRLFINPSIFGYKSHMLFLGINRLDLNKEKELYTFLSTIPNITFVVKHIGRWRIGMEIETKTEKEFQEVFVEIRGRFSEMITDFESFPLFTDHAINYFPRGNLK